MWALVFFLLEHAEDTPPDNESPAVLDLAVTLVTTPNISNGLHRTILQVMTILNIFFNGLYLKMLYFLGPRTTYSYKKCNW